MRYKIVFAVGSLALFLFMLAPTSTMGQGGGKGKKGGFGKGGFGGPDPNQQFEWLSKGRGYFLINESPRFRDLGLGQMLQDKGITSGQVTRDVFVAFSEQLSSGGGPGRFQGPGGFQGGFGGPQGPGGFPPFGGGQRDNPVDALNRLAEADFNLRDRNGDGFLNQDEMPAELRAELTKWDTNRDNLISLDEYKVYYVTTRMQNRRGGGGNQQVDTVTIIIQDEVDLDARPVMNRAGKLPKSELPKWFLDYDIDKDGQVALWEWRKKGGDLKEFREWDRNNDGLITADEAIYKQRQLMVASAAAKSEDDGSSGLAMRAGNGNGFEGKKGPNNGGSEDFGFKGRGKGGKGGKGGGKGGGRGDFPPP